MSNSMSRPHFIAIADAIYNTDLSPEDRKRVVSNLIDALKQFNGNFDDDRFRKACGETDA